jgi:hypothetical protein
MTDEQQSVLRSLAIKGNEGRRFAYHTEMLWTRNGRRRSDGEGDRRRWAPSSVALRGRRQGHGSILDKIGIPGTREVGRQPVACGSEAGEGMEVGDEADMWGRGVSR